MPSATTADRRLIINADDYGLSAGVNAGILEAVSAGVVTSISVMVNTPAFADGMRALASLASPPSVGLHLNFTAGTPLSPDVRSLVDSAGRFRPLAQFAARAAMGRVRADDIARETRAQIAMLRSAWNNVSHLDSHQHVHALPFVSPAVAAAADVHPIRRPIEPSLQAGRAGTLKRFVLGVVWMMGGTASPGAAPNVRGIGMHGDRDYLDELLGVIDALPSGLTELIVHPGHADTGTRGLDPYDAPRDTELGALLSGRLRERLARGDVALARFDAGAVPAA